MTVCPYIVQYTPNTILTLSWQNATAIETTKTETTLVFENALESAVHIAREEGRVAKDLAIAEAVAKAACAVRNHTACLDSVRAEHTAAVNALSAEHTSALDSARSVTRQALEQAEQAMSCAIEEARSETRDANEAWQKAEANVEVAKQETAFVGTKLEEGTLKLTEVESTLATCQDERARCRADIDAYQEVNRELEKKLAETVARLDDASKDVPRETAEAETLQARCDALTSQLQETVLDKNELNSELNSVNTKLTTALTTLNSVNAGLSATKRELVLCHLALISAESQRDAAREDAAQKDSELAEMNAATMLHRDFSVSPSPIRISEEKLFEKASGSSNRVSESILGQSRGLGNGRNSSSSVTESVSTPFARPARDQRCDSKSDLDDCVIDELKKNLAEAYERERGLEYKLATAIRDKELVGIASRQASLSAAKRTGATPEKDDAQLRSRLQNGIESIETLKKKIKRLAQEASSAQLGSGIGKASSSAQSESPTSVGDAEETSFTKALGGTRFMEDSRLLSVESKDVSGYCDSRTPTSSSSNKNGNLFREMLSFRVGSFAGDTRSGGAFRGDTFEFPTSLDLAPGTPYSARSVNVSSASTPPAYDEKRFTALLKKGEREIANLKKRVLGFEKDDAESD